MGMFEHPNAALVERLYAAFDAGDRGALKKLIAEDAVWHVPGSTEISGDHRGHEAIFAYLAKLAELSGGRFARSSSTSSRATCMPRHWRPRSGSAEIGSSSRRISSSCGSRTTGSSKLGCSMKTRKRSRRSGRRDPSRPRDFGARDPRLVSACDLKRRLVCPAPAIPHSVGEHRPTYLSSPTETVTGPARTRSTNPADAFRSP